MGDQVELVKILQTGHVQSSEHFQENVLNIKLAEIHTASRRRDKLIATFIVVQLFCVLLAVAVNFVYLNDKIENSVRLEKQIQILTSNTSKLTSLDKQLSYDSDMKDLIKSDKDSRGNEGNPGVCGNQGNTGKTEVKGERGETGLQGPIGASGIKGEKGNDGLIGTNGQIGDKGTIGEVGPRSINGKKGEKGIKGEKGPIGEKGVSGEKGPNGDNGIIGEKGSTGMKGLTGDKGEKGTIGDKGQNGAKGLEGDKGAAGAQGTEGQKGSKGEMGSSGIIGPIGIKGVNGADGVAGVKGSRGEIGLPGLKGEHGQKGIKGNMGTTGPTGAIGDNGPKGAGGEKGEKGNSGEPAKKMACGSGWGQFMGSCYNFQLNSRKTWNDAKIDCQRKGGYLVKIEDVIENWFLKSLVSGGSVWIGAHDSTRESRFIWVSDNTPVTFTDWSTNQPDNWRNGEDCVHFHSSTNKWNDAGCLHKMGYICEKH